jgi:anti-sigma B factor antagonist
MNHSSDEILEIDAGELKIFRREISGDLGTNPDRVVFKIEGEINMYSSLHIKESIEDRLNSKPQHFFLDLQNVTYIDSSGLGNFLGLHSKLKKAGGGIHLCSPSDRVQYVLELTKLKGLLNVFDSVWQGLEKIGVE